MICDRRITNWYRVFNNRWFGGELPEDVDVIWAPIGKCCADINVLHSDPESYVLRINPAFALDKNIARISLLHEMTHIKLWPYKLHGQRFHAEIQRLAAMGAYRGLL